MFKINILSQIVGAERYKKFIITFVLPLENCGMVENGNMVYTMGNMVGSMVNRVMESMVGAMETIHCEFLEY